MEKGFWSSFYLSKLIYWQWRTIPATLERRKKSGIIYIYIYKNFNLRFSKILPRNYWRTSYVCVLFQMKIETRKWPYDFPVSDEFPLAVQRGSVRGRLLINDRYYFPCFRSIWLYVLYSRIVIIQKYCDNVKLRSTIFFSWFRYMNPNLFAAKFAYVGLAPPGDQGTWQLDAKVNKFLEKYLLSPFQ